MIDLMDGPNYLMSSGPTESIGMNGRELAANEQNSREADRPAAGTVKVSFEILVGGVGAVAILAGGLVGETLGLRPATAVAALGMTMTFLWLFF